MAKEATHKESLSRLDFIVAAAVIAVGRNDPPASPAPGDCYVVGDAPTGDWSGQPKALASFTESGWRFASAVDGLTVLDRQSGCFALFDGTNWKVGEVRAERVTIGGNQVLGARQPAIANHASDATVNAILAALREHGLIAT